MRGWSEVLGEGRVRCVRLCGVLVGWLIVGRCRPTLMGLAVDTGMAARLGGAGGGPDARKSVGTLKGS